MWSQLSPFIFAQVPGTKGKSQGLHGYPLYSCAILLAMENGSFLSKVNLCYFYSCMCTHIHGTHVETTCPTVYGGQRATWWNLFSPFNLKALGTELRLPRIAEQGPSPAESSLWHMEKAS